MATNTIDQRKPVAQSESSSTGEAIADIMDQHNVGCVVITEDGTPEGIVTDRDLAIALGTSDLEAREIIAEDIMRAPVKTIEKGSSLLQVVQTMASANVRRLPVVDEDNQLVDIVTLDDIVKITAETLGGLEDVIETESPRDIDNFA